MPYYVGLDSGWHTTNVCVVTDRGDAVAEAQLETSPEAIIAFLGRRRRYKALGIEAATAPYWLRSGLAAAGLNVVAIETQLAHGVLKARANKTDRNDARGIAELMRIGAYRAVHDKSAHSRRTRLLVGLRRVFQRKQNDLEKALCAIHHEFGLKTRRGGAASFGKRALSEAMRASDQVLVEATKALLEARAMLRRQVKAYERRIVMEASRDPVCRRLMTAPGVGPITAATYRAAVDDPLRFHDSRNVAAHFGLTPRTRQSGVRDVRGRISKRGDAAVRTNLFLAARTVLHMKRSSDLQIWARRVAERRGIMKAYVAVARRLAVLLHRLWVTEIDYRWSGVALPDRP